MTCHMRSHSVTCHPAEVTFPPLPEPKLVLDLAIPEGCKAELTCTPSVHPLTEWTIPVFAFPAEPGTHLPTPEGWKAELALSGWLVTYWNRCPAPGIEPDTVTHLSTNGVWRRLTSLIRGNVWVNFSYETYGMIQQRSAYTFDRVSPDRLG